MTTRNAISGIEPLTASAPPAQTCCSALPHADKPATTTPLALFRRRGNYRGSFGLSRPFRATACVPRPRASPWAGMSRPSGARNPRCAPPSWVRPTTEPCDADLPARDADCCVSNTLRQRRSSRARRVRKKSARETTHQRTHPLRRTSATMHQHAEQTWGSAGHRVVARLVAAQ